MADLGIIFLRRRYPIHWYQSSYIFITGSMPFRYFWATLYITFSIYVTIIMLKIFILLCCHPYGHFLFSVGEKSVGFNKPNVDLN